MSLPTTASTRSARTDSLAQISVVLRKVSSSSVLTTRSVHSTPSLMPAKRRPDRFCPHGVQPSTTQEVQPCDPGRVTPARFLGEGGPVPGSLDRTSEKARVTAGIHRSDAPSRGTGGVLGLHAATLERELLIACRFARLPRRVRRRSTSSTGSATRSRAVRRSSWKRGRRPAAARDRWRSGRRMRDGREARLASGGCGRAGWDQRSARRMRRDARHRRHGFGGARDKAILGAP